MASSSPPGGPAARRVVLVHLDAGGGTSARFRVFNRLRWRPTLGLLYVAAGLRRAGVEVAIVQQSVAGRSVEDIARDLIDRHPAWVGLYFMSFDRPAVWPFVRRLSGAGLTVVAGGPGGVHFAAAHAAGVAVVCHGEGDLAGAEIDAALAGRGDLAAVAGISYVDAAGEIRRTPSRPPIADLDALPLPAWDLLPIERCADATMLTARRPLASLLASRGCPYRCDFCAGFVIPGRGHRSRSVDSVLQEVELLAARHGVRYLSFEDELFAPDGGWLEDFARRLAGSGAPRRPVFKCIQHPALHREPRLGERRLGALAGAGCDIVSWGLQSADPGRLEAIGRDRREPEWLAAAVACARRLGMRTAVDLMTGLPGETAGSIAATRRWVERVAPDYVGWAPLTVMPGTPLWERFGHRPLTDLPRAEIEAAARRGMLAHFLRPRVVARHAAAVLARNPGWLAHLPALALGAARGLVPGRSSRGTWPAVIDP